MIRGNLITLAEEGIFDVIVHGCNCFHVMGAGIAKEIATRYHEIADIDKYLTKYGDINKLGNYTWKKVTAPNGYTFNIINAYTQYHYGRKKEMYVDYNAIRSVFNKIRQQFPKAKIGYPRIGAGLAGGNWAIIQQIINQELRGLKHELVVL